jgi:outer membrane protein OmpA-like peptidoglycan-associated protein
MVKVVALGALVVGGLSLGGCKNVSKADYDAMLGENTELRDKLTEEQRARQEAETRNASLEQENRDLASRADAAGKAGNGKVGGATGFESSGFESYRTAGGEVVVSALGDVLFDSGKATLKPTARKSLDKVASVIQSQYAGHIVRVEGYSDTDPIKKSNWKTNERLSGERALAVEEYLTGRGLSRDQIYYAGFGSARPKGSKKDSRRVEIVILAGQR